MLKFHVVIHVIQITHRTQIRNQSLKALNRFTEQKSETGKPEIIKMYLNRNYLFEIIDNQLMIFFAVLKTKDFSLQLA